MKLNIKYIILILLIILVLTAVFFLQKKQNDNSDVDFDNNYQEDKSVRDAEIEERKQEIIKQFNEDPQLFKKVANFISSKEEEYFSVSKRYKDPYWLRVNIGTVNKFEEIEASEYSEIQSELSIIMFRYNFNDVYKMDNEIVFEKGVWSQDEQGIVFPLTKEGPYMGLEREEIEDNWYYYLEILD